MASRSVLPVAILVFLIAGFVLHVIALATPEWSTFGVNGTFVRQGLFQTCFADKCHRIENPSDNVKASVAFGVMGCLALLAAASCSFFSLVKEVDGDMAPRIARVLCFLTSSAAATLIVICVITYVTNETEGVTPDIGFSLESTISAAGCLGIALLLQAVSLIRC
ncbi:hypothetical protein RRG08_012834 [Elysia crispata]|uniref:Uncharacterized protein n=1 Tax=Elysia crispata TaxID=231223 RepID=A0AAE1DU11_9GAST|nr:hypothetical protein RRG08_012834 [Elysia crispata]